MIFGFLAEQAVAHAATGEESLVARLLQPGGDGECDGAAHGRWIAVRPMPMQARRWMVCFIMCADPHSPFMTRGDRAKKKAASQKEAAWLVLEVDG